MQGPCHEWGLPLQTPPCQPPLNGRCRGRLGGRGRSNFMSRAIWHPGILAFMANHSSSFFSLGNTISYRTLHTVQFLLPWLMWCTRPKGSQLSLFSPQLEMASVPAASLAPSSILS